MMKLMFELFVRLPRRKVYFLDTIEKSTWKIHNNNNNKK